VSRSTSVTLPTRLALLNQVQRMTPQARGVLGVDLAPPAFSRDYRELVDPSGTAFRSGFLQSGFEAARQEIPELTMEEFLAGGRPGSLLHAVVEATLGSASAMLLRTSDPQQYVNALRQACLSFRGMPAPFDGGVSYGTHRYHTGDHVVIPEPCNLTPMNAPLGPSPELLAYPKYGPVVRARGHRWIGMVMATRLWGRDIPATARDVALFQALQPRSRLELHAWDYDPDFLLSEVQIAHMISTGAAPIHRFTIDEGRATARDALQARWELAARLQDETILSADTDLQLLWDRLGSDARRRTGNPRDRLSRYARDPFYRLSRDDLFTMALRRSPGLKVWVQPYEWEHARPQRFIEEMLGWVGRLSRQLASGDDYWGSRLSMLTGASEPSNLFLVTPFEHSLLDLFAARIGGDVRLDRFGNRAVPSLAEQEAYNFAARAEDFTFPSGDVLSPFPRTDAARADEGVVAFDQHTLAELASALQDEDWQRALATTKGVQADWNKLVARLNTQVDHYGMPAALRLPEI
jgi:hypothetical protein